MKTAKRNVSTKGSTVILRIVLILIGVIGTLLGGFLARGIYREWPNEFPEVGYMRLPIATGIVAALILFLLAIVYVFKLLELIDKNKSFTRRSVITLQKLKYCAYAVAAIFTLEMPAVFQVAEKEDAPGLILYAAALLIGVPITIAVFASVCQRLFQNAIDLKSENDLTV